jgi:hypothetical protein
MSPTKTPRPWGRSLTLGAQHTVHTIDVNPALIGDFLYKGRAAPCSSGPGPNGSRTYYFEPPLIGPGELTMLFYPADAST